MSVGQNLPNVTIGQSRGRLLIFFGAGLLLTLLCATLAFSWQQGKNITTFEVALCYVGAVFFGLGTCRMLWRLLSSREPVVFISRVGIRDTRLADETIAWSSVRKIVSWQQLGQKFVVLKLDPLVARRFSGGFLTRALSLMNKALGADGVIVNAGGLTMDVETLLETCKQYWGAGRPAPSDHAVPEPEPEPEPEAVS
ncbi:STM3941 family protein [Bradyrhizobium cosmicum]|uniref:STM3941 family protein n=1 Tax=Bradyrhizobium cosmicum TaxID=1404864 RepID=UPI0028E87A50|nr:STM3941 family protein [Bradyrhizobium cosmicum]